jgi:hypothetical protein
MLLLIGKIAIWSLGEWKMNMMSNTFDVIPKRKRIAIFKVGKLWLFKHFFDDKETFKALLDYYNKDQYRFEFKSTGERNNALKILKRNGFDYALVEDLKGYVVKLPKFAKSMPRFWGGSGLGCQNSRR